jgi:mRNA deadenylase 3'-5' endonuclease subunit Ccr4
MIRLTKGQTQSVILTLTEKQLLTNPNYLFVFTNRSANTEIKFVRLNNTDVSVYKDRYNEFSFVTNTNFATSLNGQYDYVVYEQTSTSNTNPAGLNALESGIMELVGTAFEFTEYATTDTYKIRQ